MTKTVIVTGANGNLGTAVTRLFLEADYKVIAIVSREEAKKELPVSEKLHTAVADLTQETATALLVKELIAAHGPVDAALLLVGGFSAGGIKDTGLSAIQQQIRLNFETAYTIARPLFAHMLEQNSGRMVFIGARPALKASAGKSLVAYGLSKSLLFTLAAYMNEEAKGKNVTVTVVAPSTIDTPQNRKAMPDANPANWVNPGALASLLEMVVSEKGAPLRETVLKVYNNA